MSWLNKLKKVLETAQTLAPVLAAFNVPGAKSVAEAVEKIQLDPGRPNDHAVSLVAASVDNIERRLISVEKALKAKGGKG